MKADGVEDHPGNCPLCGTHIHRLWARHRAACLGDPAVRAAVRAALDDGTGRALRVVEYDRIRGPVSGAHLRKFFGSWDKAAAALGLRPAGGWRAREDAPQPLTDAERAALRGDDPAICLHGEVVRVVQVRPGVVHEYIRLR